MIAVVFAVSLQARHANISIDLSRPVWVKGADVRYQPINPHTMIEFDETVGAELRRWRIEGPFLARLRFVHGHILVLPSGRLRSWGPIPTRVESSALVDEINRFLAQPCGSAPPGHIDDTHY